MSKTKRMPGPVILAAVLVSGGVGVFLMRKSAPDGPKAAAASADEATADNAVTDTQVPEREAELAQADPAGTARRDLDCQKPAGDAARVGRQAIAVERLCTELAQIGGVSAKGVDLLQARLVLDRLIDSALVEQVLAQEQVQITDADVNAALAQRNVVEPGDLVRSQMRQRLAMDKVLFLRSDLTVSERDVDEALAQGAPSVDRGGGNKVEAWLVRVAPGAPQEQQTRAKTAAEGFAQAVLQQPPDEAARTHKLQPLPAFVVQANGTEPALEAAALGLAPGQWSQAVPSRAGWVVLRGVQAVAGEPLTDAELREMVRIALMSRKKTAEQQRVLAALRAGGQVDVLVKL